MKKRLQDLMTINGEIDQRQKNIEGIQKDIQHIEGNIGILNAQLKTLEQQLQDRKNKYIRSMRYMSRHHSVQEKLMDFTGQSAEEYPRTQSMTDACTTVSLPTEMLINNISSQLSTSMR